MSTTATTTAAVQEGIATLRLRGQSPPVKPQALRSEETQARRDAADAQYGIYLPTFDDIKYPPLTDFDHSEPGLRALKHDDPKEFLKNATLVDDLTPLFGTEVKGVSLAQLDSRGREQLALLVAERGVVAFRGQDEFINQSPEWLVDDWTAFFGRPHIHPTSSHPKDRPFFHLVYRDDDKVLNYETSDLFTSSVWHSDVTYEKQPPGLTALWMFDSPPSGGDTAYASQVEAYNRLSPSFAAYLETLSVVHSGVAQAENSRGGNRGGVVRREPIETVHPLVRRHPVTGKKALFVNKQFSRRIVGLKTPESKAILNVLYEHIAQGLDFQVRVRHQPGTVVLWDNRITAHSAIVDNYKGRRWGARLTPQAEMPSQNP
ncbi:sulfonate dioxygenase, partial [Tremellales sp. Uapishka_1]